MTLTEVLVSSVILGLSSQVSLQGWSRTSNAALASAHLDQQVQLLEQRLLASRRVLASAPVADVDCRWDLEAVSGVLEGLSEDSHPAMSWRFDAAGVGLWLDVELMGSKAAQPIKRSQLFTPAGLGHCPREASDES